MSLKDIYNIIDSVLANEKINLNSYEKLIVRKHCNKRLKSLNNLKSKFNFLLIFASISIILSILINSLAITSVMICVYLLFLILKYFYVPKMVSEMVYVKKHLN